MSERNLQLINFVQHIRAGHFDSFSDREVLEPPQTGWQELLNFQDSCKPVDVTLTEIDHGGSVCTTETGKLCPSELPALDSQLLNIDQHATIFLHTLESWIFHLYGNLLVFLSPSVPVSYSSLPPRLGKLVSFMRQNWENRFFQIEATVVTIIMASKEV